MKSIKIQIPDKDCQNCPYLKCEIIDHNYYGEMTHKHQCSVFNSKINEYNPCDACKAAIKRADQELHEYVDFLVDEINLLLRDSYCNAIEDFVRELKPKVTRPEIIEQIAQRLKEVADS